MYFCNVNVLKTEELTIVIPVYNRARELKECLDSLSIQTLLPTRVIVVDDGSNDDSVDVARRHPIGAEVIESDHKGAAAARNAGLGRVTTPWVMFFDSDDIMTPYHIETAMSGVHEGVDLVGWDVTVRFGTQSRRVFKFQPENLLWNNIMHGSLSTLRYMARTDLFRKAGGWNPHVTIWDDIELGVRLLALKPVVAKVSGNNVIINFSEISITGPKWSAVPNQRYAVALEHMERNLPAKNYDWICLKQAILAGDIGREDKSKGREMFASIKKKSFPVRVAYFMKLYGIRGAARLLRPFLSHAEP